MNPVAKQMWLDALRSGKYEQGQGALHLNDSGRMCCLGVLCAESAELLDLKVVIRPGLSDYVEYDGNDMMLPQKVVEWAFGPKGSANPDMVLDDGLGHTEDVTLATLNDEREYTFEQIADLIEEQL